MTLRQMDVVRHYEQNQALALEQLSLWGALHDEIDEVTSLVSLERAQALAALAVAYLPALTPDAIARAEKLSGFRGFSRRDPLKAMEHERDVLTRTIKRVEADVRWQRREFLVGPAGELTQAVEEAQAMLEPWEADCRRYEELEGWAELLESAYDTPAFAVSFFTSRYWTLWGQGDAVCVSLGLDDFGDDVLPAFAESDRHRQAWRAQLAEARGKVDEVHELARTRDLAEGRIPRLGEIYLHACQGHLAKYFAEADLALLEEWLADDAGDGEPDRAVLIGLRRVSGLTAKERLLNELLSGGVGASARALRTRMDKFMRKATKFGREKHRHQAFTEGVMDRGFAAKHSKVRSRVGKLSELVQRIARYDRYAVYDLANNPDELWFLEMTGKRPPLQLPSTRRWYDRHPDRAPAHVHQDSDGAALLIAAAAAHEADELGYLS